MLRSIDLVLNKMGFEVFVRDETIAIGIKSTEYLEGSRLALAVSQIFDLRQDTAESSCGGFVTNLARLLL